MALDIAPAKAHRACLASATWKGREGEGEERKERGCTTHGDPPRVEHLGLGKGGTELAAQGCIGGARTA